MSLSQSIRQRLLVGGFTIVSVIVVGIMIFYVPIQADTIAGQATSNEAYKQQVLNLVNQYRTSQGLTPLIRNSQLDQSAQNYTNLVANSNYNPSTSLAWHVGPDGSKIEDRIRAVGYQAVNYAENFAAGQPDPQSVVAGWKGSTGHDAMLRFPFVHIGIGYSYRPGTVYGAYWALHFGTPANGTTPQPPAVPPQQPQLPPQTTTPTGPINTVPPANPPATVPNTSTNPSVPSTNTSAQCTRYPNLPWCLSQSTTPTNSNPVPVPPTVPNVPQNPPAYTPYTPPQNPPVVTTPYQTVSPRRGAMATACAGLRALGIAPAICRNY
jgi:uncharacterized protein YkwD